MKILKRSQRARPRLSIVLVDWSVRESFHLLSYLSRQQVPRDDFEVLVIEYYSRQSEALRPHLAQVDTWAMLDMPVGCYYHKHLMYNAGIVLARGEVVLFCDSDAMVRPSFVGSVLGAFETSSRRVLHLDQFRNLRRSFYPFNYPSFADVVGSGCANWVDGKTTGLSAPADPLHERNYGACMAARRADLIAIGGADEHLDYLGHICGPYDMTFRLVNAGCREMWHETEFLYHTWHPGQAGVGNYLGPHDGRHMSTTALDALVTGRVLPLLENPAIAGLRTHRTDAGHDRLIRGVYQHLWRTDLVGAPVAGWLGESEGVSREYKGFRIAKDGAEYLARPLAQHAGTAVLEIRSASVPAVREAIDRAVGHWRGTTLWASPAWFWMYSGGRQFRLRFLRWPAWLRRRRIGGGRLKRLLAQFRRSIATRGLATTLRLGLRGSREAARKVARFVAAIPQGLGASFTRTIDRVKRFAMEARVQSQALTSLVVSLHMLRENSPSAPASTITVVVDAGAVARHLRWMITAGVLPPVELQVIKSETEARHASERIRQRAADRALIGRLCFARYHGTFDPVDPAGRVVIV